MAFLRRLVGSWVRSPHLADDCFQEALIRLAGEMGAGKVPPGEVRRYAVTAARIATLRTIEDAGVIRVNGYGRYGARRRGSAAAGLGAAAVAVMDRATWSIPDRPASPASDVRMADDIAGAIEKLTAKQADVFRLRAAGISQRAVARELGMKRDNVRIIEKWAVAKLRKALAAYAD